MAAADAAAASLNTSRGCTTVVSSEPIDSDLDADDAVLRVEHHDAELLDRRGAVLRQQVARQLSRRLVSRGRSFAPRTSVRRPSSTAASNLRRARARRCPVHAQLVRRGARQAVQSARAFEQPVRQFERVALARAAAEHDRDQLVVAERGDAEPLQLLARPIVLGDFFHCDILKSS